MTKINTCLFSPKLLSKTLKDKKKKLQKGIFLTKADNFYYYFTSSRKIDPYICSSIHGRICFCACLFVCFFLEFFNHGRIEAEPRYNEGPRDWQNLFAITRFRYNKVLSDISYYYWGKANRSLYRRLRHIKVRFIEVPL